MSLLSHSLQQIQKRSWFNTMNLTVSTLKDIRALAAVRRRKLTDFLKSCDRPQSRSQIMAGCQFDLSTARSTIDSCEKYGLIARKKIENFLHWYAVQ